MARQQRQPIISNDFLLKKINCPPPCRFELHPTRDQCSNLIEIFYWKCFPNNSRLQKRIASELQWSSSENYTWYLCWRWKGGNWGVRCIISVCDFGRVDASRIIATVQFKLRLDYLYDTEAEIQLPLNSFPNSSICSLIPSWLRPGEASGHQKLASNTRG